MSCRAQRYMHGSKSDKVPKYTILARPTADRGDGAKTNCSTDALPVFVPSSLLTNSSTSDNSDTSSRQLEHSAAITAVPLNENLQPVITTDIVSQTLTGHNLSNAVSQQLNLNSNDCQPQLPQKTPVCRINDLARFNKIAAQFVLVAEEGPPHKKTFYIQLTLGDEVYHDSAESMKKAQHSVASMALTRTRYPHPPTKCLKQQHNQQQQQQQQQAGPRITSTSNTTTSNTTSDIESVDVVHVLSLTSNVSSCHNSQLIHHSSNFPTIAAAAVTNDDHCYRTVASDSVVLCGPTDTNVVVTGAGPSTLPSTNTSLQLPSSQSTSTTTSNGFTFVNSDSNTTAASNDITVAVLATGIQQQQQLQQQADDCRLHHNIQLTAGRQTVPKSVINEVQELAVKMGLLVTYDTIEETPAPNFSYSIKCRCGSCETCGEGCNKKTAKKNAAELMLVELQRLAAVCVAPTLDDTTPRKIWQKKKRPKNTVVKADDFVGTEESAEQNHVGLLLHLQQARRGSQPVYKDVGVRGTDFIVEVYVDTFMCIGFGRTKKLAKRDAAEKMLNALSVGNVSADINNTPPPLPPPAKSALKRANSTHSAEKKVTFCEPDTVAKQDVEPTSSLIVIQKSHTVFPKYFSGSPTSDSQHVSRTEDKPRIRVLQRPKSAANQVSPTDGINQVPAVRMEDKAPAVEASSSPDDCVSPVHLPTDIMSLSPVERLQSTVSLLHVNFQFTDLPKASGSKEYLSIVTISTNPPQITHGVGSCLELAHDDASLKALLMLKQLGFIVQPTVSNQVHTVS